MKTKICSRGHKYSGAGPCPVCWPGGVGKREVDVYIAKAPKAAQAHMKALRKLILDVAPGARQSISYGMPYFNHRGRFAWFASQRGYVGLYLRPPVIAAHAKELSGYKTTKSAIHFPLDEKLPVTLIKRLLKDRKRRDETELKNKKK